MNTNQEPVDYSFGAYRLAGSRQALFRDGEEVPVSTKLYYLLLALVRRQGEVLTKDDLIEAAWPGQVVTDAALAKQMLRVRRLIDDQDRTPPFIETHRGIGYRFNEPVSRAAAIADQGPATSEPTGSGAGRRLALVLTALVVAGLALTWWITRGADEPGVADSGPAPTDPSQAHTISLALLPAREDAGWLSEGGLDYLSERLRRDPAIQTLVVRPDTGLSGDSTQQAIEITTFDQVQYAATFGFEETETGFAIEAMLRNDREEVARASLEGDSLADVFTAADRWLRHELAVHARLSEIESRLAGPVDAYALQSYLQGVHELLGMDDKPTAAQYFQAAVNKDPDFLEAWVKLVSTRLELGEFQRAIATSETLLQRDDVAHRPAVAAELHRVIGLAHARLQDEKAATQSLQRALAIAPAELAPQARMDLLGTLELRARLQDELAEAERLGLERLALAQEHAPLPNVVADIHLSLAETMDQARRWDDLRRHVEAALALYEQSGNDNGMLRGFLLLNEVNYALNDREAGVQVVRRAAPYLDRASLVHEKAFFYQISAQILNTQGHFERVQDFAARLRDLSTESGNPMYMVLSEFIKVHQLYVAQRFGDALDHTRTMMEQFDRDDALRAALPRTLAVAILVSSRIEAPAETRLLIRRFNQEYPSLRDEYRLEFLRAEGHLAVRSGRVDEGLAMLREARGGHAARGEAHVAQYIGFEILEVLLDQPGREYRPLLAQLEQESGYDYLLWKLKAAFLAREGDFVTAAIVMGENRLKANDLWTSQDQLMLEEWRARAGNPGP